MKQSSSIAAARWLFGASLCWVWHCSSHAGDALSLMQSAQSTQKARDESVRYTMELFDGEQRVHVRQLQRQDKVSGSKSSTVVRFTAPEAVRHVSLLIEDSGAALNDIWSYMPASKRLRRISGAQKQSWFMGTEFCYEDFEDFKLGSYQFEEAEAIAPCLTWRRCLVVDARPNVAAESAASGYSRKRYFLEAESLYPVQVEYFDAAGEVTKRLVVSELQRYGAHSRPVSQTMINLKNQRSTRITATDVRINQGISEARFTPRFLRNEDQ
jgi:Outer membrane lipoprotein-sorting protein